MWIIHTWKYDHLEIYSFFSLKYHDNLSIFKLYSLIGKKGTQGTGFIYCKWTGETSCHDASLLGFRDIGNVSKMISRCLLSPIGKYWDLKLESMQTVTKKNDVQDLK